MAPVGFRRKTQLALIKLTSQTSKINKRGLRISAALKTPIKRISACVYPNNYSTFMYKSIICFIFYHSLYLTAKTIGKWQVRSVLSLYSVLEGLRLLQL